MLDEDLSNGSVLPQPLVHASATRRSRVKIYCPNQKRPHSWKCSVNDVMKSVPFSDAMIYRDNAGVANERKSRKITIGRRTAASKLVLCAAAGPWRSLPVAKQTSLRLDIFFFASDVAVGMMLRVAFSSSMRLITLLVFVNVFTGIRVVFAAAVARHSPGFLRWTHACHGLSLCVRADGKHEHVRFGT